MQHVPLRVYLRLIHPTSSLWKFVLLLSLFVYIFLCVIRTHSRTRREVDPTYLTRPGQPEMQMIIVNAVRYHGEVWYSYLYAAAIRCHWRVSLFTVFSPPIFGHGNGLAYITKSWSDPLLSTPQQHVKQLLESSSIICSHSIIIICTLENSHLGRILDVLLNECDERTSYLVLLQLHWGREDIPKFEHVFKSIPSLQLQKRVELRYLALAEHVKNFAENNMTMHFGIDIWRPGFSLDLPVHAEEDQYDQHFDFVIQGRLDDKRRDYFRLAANIKRHQHMLHRQKIVFTIVGVAETLDKHAYLNIPGVRLFLSPRYMPANAFYSFIHQAVGIIPIFGTDNYYIDKQSSSIFCSLLNQTPLLASQRLLDSQRYISAEAVWLQYDNETEVDAVLRIVRSFSSVAAFKKTLYMKRQRLKKLLEKAYFNNERTLTTYANVIKQRTKSLENDGDGE